MSLCLLRHSWASSECFCSLERKKIRGYAWKTTSGLPNPLKAGKCVPPISVTSRDLESEITEALVDNSECINISVLSYLMVCPEDRQKGQSLRSHSRHCQLNEMHVALCWLETSIVEGTNYLGANKGMQ